MNWQLLIKMVSFSLHPALEWRVLLSGKSTERESRNESSLLKRIKGVDKGGSPAGRGRRDAVSILFVHANYSSWVTLLQIEGTFLLYEKKRKLNNRSPLP